MKIVKPYQLKVGERVWNEYSNEFAYIEAIQGEKDILTITEDNCQTVITLMDEPLFEKSTTHNEVFADDLYKIADGKDYDGYEVCFDKYDTDKEQYYCPVLGILVKL